MSTTESEQIYYKKCSDRLQVQLNLNRFILPGSIIILEICKRPTHQNILTAQGTYTSKNSDNLLQHQIQFNKIHIHLLHSTTATQILYTPATFFQQSHVSTQTPTQHPGVHTTTHIHPPTPIPTHTDKHTHKTWFFTGVTAPWSLQSKESGMASPFGLAGAAGVIQGRGVRSHLGVR